MTLTAEKYRELFRLRATGELEPMECTNSLCSLLASRVGDATRVLDVACGVGHYYERLRTIAEIDYTGVDLDPHSVGMAQEVWTDDANARFIVAPSNELPFAERSFDVVICYNLVLHLPEFEATLRELLRVSRSAVLLRSLFDEGESRESVEVAEDYLHVYPSGRAHYNTYARGAVERLCRSVGGWSVRFIRDNRAIPQESLKRQSELLGAAASEFATQEREGDSQAWRGMSLNYEVALFERTG